MPNLEFEDTSAGLPMATMTIRNIPDNVHHALKVRAALNNRSAEAEVRALLEQAVQPRSGVALVEALHQFGREVGIADEDLTAFEREQSDPRDVELP